MKLNSLKIIILVAIIGIPTGIITYLTLNQETTPTDEPSTTANYTNGNYTATGHYISPGGPEEVAVALTLENGIITAVDYSASSTRPISANLQKIFGENYKPFVLGKHIDTVHLTKISTSSLTPKGFNDALEKIKEQARS